MSNRPAVAWKMAGLCFVLIALVWLVFGQTLGHQFVNFDDESYVYANPAVNHGLTPSSIGWAFTHIVSHNWHPLTVISHMLDCELFDLNPAGHHLTNVLLHAVAAVLLFLATWSMTSALWRSAFVAAVFAIHPLHVESVAWIAERKDVLSAVFFILTLIAYVHYTHRPSFPRYLLMSIVFAFGLMSKPMLITVPFVLLLLDYWPLQRLQLGRSPVPRIVAEKIPLLMLSIPVAVITLLIQRHGIDSVESSALPWRVSNAFVSTLVYLRQMALPINLAVFYPHLGEKLPIWQAALASVSVIALTVLLVLVGKKRPYLLVGWLWYLVMLIPVIGIIQVGSQAHADRYTYLPQIGLYLAITWAVADFSQGRPNHQFILGTTAALMIGLLAWCARTQVRSWRDSESLWAHALGVAKDNEMAHERLASAFLDKGRLDEAIEQAQLALNFKADSASAESVFGVALARRGQNDEALSHFRRALEIDPNLSRLHYNIANLLAAKGDTAQAGIEYEEQLKIDPNFAEAQNNFANLLLQQGQFEEAARHLTMALQLKPNYAAAHNNLAVVLSQKGRINEAVEQWEKTLSIDPNNSDAHCNLAWVLATSPESSVRNGRVALRHAESALYLSGEANPRIWRLVAAANAELGRFDAAIAAAQRALALAQRQSNTALAAVLESNIASFRNAAPLRDYRSSN